MSRARRHLPCDQRGIFSSEFFGFGPQTPGTRGQQEVRVVLHCLSAEVKPICLNSEDTTRPSVDPGDVGKELEVTMPLLPVDVAIVDSLHNHLVATLA